MGRESIGASAAGHSCYWSSFHFRISGRAATSETRVRKYYLQGFCSWEILHTQIYRFWEIM